MRPAEVQVILVELWKSAKADRTIVGNSGAAGNRCSHHISAVVLMLSLFLGENDGV